MPPKWITWRPLLSISQTPYALVDPPSDVPDIRTRCRDVHHRGTQQAIANFAASLPPLSPGEGMGEGACPVDAEVSGLRESMTALDDNYRRMLFDAARGDARARMNALATMPLWWDRMPADLIGEIEMRIRARLGVDPKPSDIRLSRQANDLKLRSFLARLRPRRGVAV